MNKGTDMARVSTYLNFPSKTEEAFLFYKEVFGTEFIAQIDRMGDVPVDPSMPELTDEEKNLVMNVQLPILAGHVLMGTDTLEKWGHTFTAGNNVSINLEPDTLAEGQRIFDQLSTGGTEINALQKMFWGDHWGSFVDKFGTRWMMNCTDTST